MGSNITYDEPNYRNNSIFVGDNVTHEFLDIEGTVLDIQDMPNENGIITPHAFIDNDWYEIDYLEVIVE